MNVYHKFCITTSLIYALLTIFICFKYSNIIPGKHSTLPMANSLHPIHVYHWCIASSMA